MEANVALELSIKIFADSNGRLYIEELVSDNDSTMRSILTHKALNEKGQSPEEIPAISFLTEPIHRIKVMTKPVYSKVTDTKDPGKCKKHDANGLKNT